MDPQQPPVDPEATLSAVSSEMLARQVSWQLQSILRDRVWTSQQPLGVAAGYTVSSAQSRMSAVINRRRMLTVQNARALDESLTKKNLGRFYGFSFTELTEAYEADRRSGGHAATEVDYDVFLATPMASAASYEDARSAGMRITDAISSKCGLSVYNASAPIKTQLHFDRTDLAYEDNVNALRHSKIFVLHIDEPLVAPSSIWVEAGFALALKLPCLFMAPTAGDLPYILRKAVHNANTHPTTAILELGNRDAADVIAGEPRLVKNLLPKFGSRRSTRAQ